MNEALISCIIPVYNREKIIINTLQDVINQEYPNLEIIIINDGSTDNTYKVCKELLENSNRKYIIINLKKNFGAATARNKGLEKSNGEYVWFCDSDDRVHKLFLRALYDAIINNDDVDISYCAITIKQYNKDCKKLMFPPYLRKAKDFLETDLSSTITHNPCNIWLPCMLIRKELLTENNLTFYDGCIMGEDIEFWRKLLCHADSMIYLEDAFYTYIPSHYKNKDINIKREQCKSYKESLLRTIKYLKKYINNTNLADNLLIRIRELDTIVM